MRATPLRRAAARSRLLHAILMIGVLALALALTLQFSAQIPHTFVVD